jgi:hypothetical protein
LEGVDVAGLHLCLHQKTEDAVPLLGEDAQNADLGLSDDGLRPLRPGTEARTDADPANLKVSSGLVGKGAAVVEPPAGYGAERDPLDVELLTCAEIGPPRLEPAGRRRPMEGRL